MKNERPPEELIQLIQNKFLKINARLITCESCTSGLLNYSLSQSAGASKWLDGGWVTYSHSFKNTVFPNCESIQQQFGSVSPEAVSAIAKACIDQSQATHSLVVSGIAGPDGGSLNKPVGLCYIAVADQKTLRVTQIQGKGSRYSNQSFFVEQALLFLLSEVSQ